MNGRGTEPQNTERSGHQASALNTSHGNGIVCTQPKHP
jgi:hypothetical protein